MTKAISTNCPTARYEIRKHEGIFIAESVDLYSDLKPRRYAEIGRFETEEEAVIAAIKNCYKRGLAIA